MPTGIYVRTDEAKANMSIAQKGRIFSTESRAKMSEAGTGRLISSETRMKISEHNGMKGKLGILSPYWKGGPIVTWHKRNAKRRLLRFNPLNSWFPGSVGHHLNSQDVLYIPKKLHRSVYHNQHTGQGMEQMNVLALVWYINNQMIEETSNKCELTWEHDNTVFHLVES